MKNKYITPIVVIAFLVFAALACALPTPSATATAAATTPPSCDTGKAAITLTKQDNGRPIALKKGEKFAISLASNRTTGYEWTVDGIDNAFLRYDDKIYVGTGFAVGSGGVETLCFTAINTGKTSLSVIYHRTFDKNVAPIETFKVTVEIK
jgi:inhibitor of cysteine peptidase